MQKDENGKISMSEELLMLHLLKRMKEEQIINIKTYNKCVMEVKADGSSK